MSQNRTGVQISNNIWKNKIPRYSYRFLIVVCVGLFNCSGKSDSNKSGSSVKFEQYFVQGEQLYLTHCSNCHQKNGSGLGLVYPPVNKSDYMDNNFDAVICLIRNGKSGELVVNGKNYNQAMPAIPTLTDLEVAEIATFIYNSWENSKGIVEVQKVSRILSMCDSTSSLTPAN